MPGIQSPGKLVNQWKKDKTEFLKQVSEVSKVQTQREPKVLENLKVLVAIAQKDERARQGEREHFDLAKLNVKKDINKIRLSYVKQKADRKVKPYFSRLGKMVIVVDSLNLAELDANEFVTAKDLEALSQIDESHLSDVEEDERESHPSQQEQHEEVKQETRETKPVPPPRPNRPPSPKEPISSQPKKDVEKPTGWTAVKKQEGEGQRGNFRLGKNQPLIDYQNHLKKLMPDVLIVQKSDVTGGNAFLEKKKALDSVATATGHGQRHEFDQAEDVLDELEQFLPTVKKTIAIQIKHNEITGPITKATETLGKLGGEGEILTKLRQTPQFSKSDGLKKLAKQVEEIDAEVKRIEEEPAAAKKPSKSHDLPRGLRRHPSQNQRHYQGVRHLYQGARHKFGEDDRVKAAKTLRRHSQRNSQFAPRFHQLDLGPESKGEFARQDSLLRRSDPAPRLRQQRQHSPRDEPGGGESAPGREGPAHQTHCGCSHDGQAQ